MHTCTWLYIQLCTYAEDFDRERSDRIRAAEKLERMQQELIDMSADHTINYNILKSNIDLLTKQMKDKEQELQISHHQVSYMLCNVYLHCCKS